MSSKATGLGSFGSALRRGTVIAPSVGRNQIALAQEPARAFQHYTSSVGAQLGSTVRVIVIDRNDCIVREPKCSPLSGKGAPWCDLLATRVAGWRASPDMPGMA